MANPSLSYTPVPLGPTWTVHEQLQSWGSEGINIPSGYITNTKPRWQVTGYQYQDVGAMEKFGVHPGDDTSGIIMATGPYGYPVQGFTTGYTMKLPPTNIGIQAASQVPRSGVGMSTVAVGGGTAPQPIQANSEVAYMSQKDPDFVQRLNDYQNSQMMSNLPGGVAGEPFNSLEDAPGSEQGPHNFDITPGTVPEAPPGAAPARAPTRRRGGGPIRRG